MKETSLARSMGSVGKLHMLHTCPFCWKVRGLLEHLNLDYEAIQINPMKSKNSQCSGMEKSPNLGSIQMKKFMLILHL